MRDYKSLAHTKWDCKYHIVFIPKYRKKVIYGNLRDHLGEIFHELADHREWRIEEGHLVDDHVHIAKCQPTCRIYLKLSSWGLCPTAIKLRQNIKNNR